MTRFALVLGALSAIGPFAIDMYLPALPVMAKALHANAGEVELSLTSFFLGLTFGQLLYGPVSDRAGRRLPIFIGLIMFLAGSIACGFAPNVHLLIAARLIEGLGASAGVVVGTAVIRDIYTGAEAARLMALRLLVLGVSPVLAPMAGAAIVAVAPWPYIFWTVTVLGAGCLLLVFLLLPETLAEEKRASGSLSSAFSAYLGVLADRRMLGLAIGAALGQGAFFAYLAGSSFVFIDVHGLSPWMYSFVFAINAVGLVVGAQFVPQLIHKLGSKRLILIASTVQAVAVAVLLAAAVLHLDSLPVLLVCLFVSVSAFGQSMAPATMLAMRDHTRSAGTASAVIGTCQMAGGVVASGLIGALANGTAMPMIAVIAVCGLASLAVYRQVLRNEPA